MKHTIEEIPRCEISLRVRYLVDGRYRVENGTIGRYGITDLRTEQEYVAGVIGCKTPFWEYEVVSKKGRRRTAYDLIVSVRVLRPDGPRATLLTSIARAVVEYEATTE